MALTGSGVSVNQKLLQIMPPEQVQVEIWLLEEEMVMAHHLRLTGQLLAYTFGQRKD